MTDDSSEVLLRLATGTKRAPFEYDAKIETKRSATYAGKYFGKGISTLGRLDEEASPALVEELCAVSIATRKQMSICRSF